MCHSCEPDGKDIIFVVIRSFSPRDNSTVSIDITFFVR